jgi:hypothetical protein
MTREEILGRAGVVSSDGPTNLFRFG